MTSDVFTTWLRNFDRMMTRQQRKVILLVDNAASHNTPDNERLRSVRLHYLPPNTTAHIQPMDAGIIKTFKTYYRKQLVRHFIVCAENDNPQTVNVREALHMVKTAWASVTEKTINNCFRHVDIIPQLRRPDPTPAATQSDDDDDDDDLPLSRLRDPTPAATQSDDDDDDDVPLSDLRDLLRQLPKDDNNPTMTAEEYLAIDDTLETGQALDDDDILCLVNRDYVPDAADDDDDDDAADDDDDDTQPTEVTTTQAREMITRLIPYFEQATEQTTSDERRENAAFLDQLWAMADVIQKRSTTRSRQTTIADFFKK